MRKRYGITNNPERREKELRSSYDGVKNFKKVEKIYTDKNTMNLKMKNWEKYKRVWSKKKGKI